MVREGDKIEKPYRGFLGSTGIACEPTRPPLPLRRKCSSNLPRASFFVRSTALARLWGRQDARVLLPPKRQSW